MRGNTDTGSDSARRTETILFVCLHGSAKSLIAAEHLNRMAQARGLAVRAESAGIEPDTEVPPAVVAGLAADGIDVRTYRPGFVTPTRLAAAARAVGCGCDLGTLAPPGARVECWDDLPMVSDGYAAARDAIVERVERMLATLDTAP